MPWTMLMAVAATFLDFQQIQQRAYVYRQIGPLINSKGAAVDFRYGKGSSCEHLPNENNRN